MLKAAIVVAAESTTNPLLPATYDIVWSAVCFVIILLFFWKRVLPKMQVMLDERSAAIEGNIAKADEAQAKAESALQEYTAMLAGARSEAASIKESARAEGSAIVQEAKSQAQIEAERILHNAHAQTHAERQAAMVSLRKEVGSIALDIASGVVVDSLKDDENAKKLVDKFISELEAEEAKKVGK